MKPKLSAALSVLLVCALLLPARMGHATQLSLREAGDGFLSEVAALPGGELLLAGGFCVDPGQGPEHAYQAQVMKLNASGEAEWNALFGEGAQWDVFAGLAPLPDGRIALHRVSFDQEAFSHSVLLLQSDGRQTAAFSLPDWTENAFLHNELVFATGENRVACFDLTSAMRWETAAPAGPDVNGWTRLNQAVPVGDGLILFGASGPPSLGVVAKVDGQGAIAWQTWLPSGIAPTALHELADGALFGLGEVHSGDPNQVLHYAFLLDADGQLRGTHALDITGAVFLRGIHERDGILWVLGDHRTYAEGSLTPATQTAWLFQFNSQGELLKGEPMEGYPPFAGFVEDPSGNMYAYGNENNLNGPRLLLPLP